jgi:hypothetical protein
VETGLAYLLDMTSGGAIELNVNNYHYNTWYVEADGGGNHRVDRVEVHHAHVFWKGLVAVLCVTMPL